MRIIRTVSAARAQGSEVCHHGAAALFSALLCSSLVFSAFAGDQVAHLGLFTGHQDIGACGRPGGAWYDSATRTYTVTGGGENMWFDTDAFHFVWKQASGDVKLSALMSFAKPGGNAHRKACLIVRQSLDSDSAYADAALHGDGLASLQCRETKGGRTWEIQANTSAPRGMRIEKIGRYVSISVTTDGRAWRPAGGAFRLVLRDPFYVGLGVCAHDNKTLETAVFSEVNLDVGSLTNTNPVLISTLETVTIASKDRRAVYCTTNHIEAPNWSPNGVYFVFNSGGLLYRLPVQGGVPQRIDTGFAVRCNNDHGFSPDGKQLAISDQSEEKRSIIYTVPVSGGMPRRVTALGPSYWHGWSPDGATLAYCAERNGQFDVYTIPVQGGNETRLTSAPGLDDGPDYSPDGRFIYFNSERTGTMQIWRMGADGSNPTQLTTDEFNNWFPHPSPDGRWIVFLSYAPDVKGHPANQDVTLRIMSVDGGKPEVLAKLFGGQGTINVPSWSPDSKKVAFVSYQLQ
ncbi:MAG: hypothetical protein QHJ82_13580 [Verrucomicrobiota bacterium]|nr:hypothetical protein [Verrucomicrobiota bacterium]